MPIPYPPLVEVSVPVWPDFLDCRNPESHKGIYGHALLVAGSYGKMGAAVLAAQACLRTGTGLLTVHVPCKGVEVMQTAVPEAMVSVDPDETHWTHLFTAEELARYDAVAIGPGLGTDSIAALRCLLGIADKPLVLDADGLNMLAVQPDKMGLLKHIGCSAGAVLTPHAKEFERLFGPMATPDDRRRISADTGCVIVYKGHRTQITGRKGELYVNTTGNPGMATAGSGDVLTGMMLGILSQNKEKQLSMEECACLAVWLHGKSADLAVDNQSQCSLMAGDIIKKIGCATMCRTSRCLDN